MEYILYPFMQKAIIAAILGGAACGTAGVFVLLTGISLIGMTITHAALAGALLGLLTGINPMITAFSSSVVVSLACGPLSDWGKFKPDTSMGILFSVSAGMVFLMLALLPGPKSQGLSMLWGNILLINERDIMVMLLSSLLLMAFICMFYKEIQSVILSREMARAAGINERAIFYLMLLVTGMTITAFYSSFGGLLIFPLIINPAAAAWQLTCNLKKIFGLAALLGVASTISGLVTATVLDIPTGAATVFCSVSILLLAMLVSPTGPSIKWIFQGNNHP